MEVVQKCQHCQLCVIMGKLRWEKVTVYFYSVELHPNMSHFFVDNAYQFNPKKKELLLSWDLVLVQVSFHKAAPVIHAFRTNPGGADPLADRGGGGGGAPGTGVPLGIQILSFSCSFQQKICKIIPIWELAHPSWENPGIRHWDLSPAPEAVINTSSYSACRMGVVSLHPLLCPSVSTSL